MSKRPSDSKPPAKIRKNYLDRTKQHADSLAASNKIVKGDFRKPTKQVKKAAPKKRVPTPILPPVAEKKK